MTLTQILKKKAIEAGFVSVGFSKPNMLRDLPHGVIGNYYNLRLPEEVLPDVKSVILLGFYAWDRAFNIQVDSTLLQNDKTTKPKVPLESYQLYYEVMKNKAWSIVDYLKKRGFDSLLSFAIPLKTSAVKCGLGFQGKNTLLVSPVCGPRIRLVSVLTTAELDPDEPYRENLCKNCEKCVSACPTKALEPYKLKINRCMTYSIENPHASDVHEDVKELERRLVARPTPNSYVECTICADVCPIGKSSSS